MQSQISQVQRNAITIAEYFLQKYGKEKAKIICMKLAQAVKTESVPQLQRMGEKIALLNGWK